MFIVLLVSTGLAAQSQSPVITNTAGRTSVSLNGTWRIIVDPYETGLDGHYYENAKPKDKTDRVEYDFDTSDRLSVPGDWNTQDAKLFFYEGPIWYKRSFPYHQRDNTRVFVYFGAANYLTRVYLNGAKLGEHEGGFTAFDFEVTGKIREGDNFLIAEVDSTRRAGALPALKTDWWNYGGITRDVLLVEVPAVFIQDYFVQLAKGSRDEIAGWVQVNGASQPQAVTLEIPEAGIKKTVTTDSQGRAEFHFPASLHLWSPENPKLYEVVLSAGKDAVHDSIGFRSVETRGGQILLNGKPIFLRGISMHEEAPFRSGRAFSPQDAEILLGWAKEMGCNFLRLAHYPHNENEIRAADRMGLLIWSEVPVYWDIAWDNPVTLVNAEAQLRAMIARDHNRASIIFWSLSNETPVQPARLSFLKRLAEVARQADVTRLITSAMNHTESAEPDTQILSDPLGQYLDVLGLNEYVGWYWALPVDADRMQWKTAFDKPLIVSEFGGDALYGNHGDADTRWTEEYQASLFEHQLRMVEKMPNLAGLSPWLLMDFHTPRRPLPGIQDYYNRKGLISNRGERKQAFYVLQKFYSRKAADAIASPAKP